MRRVLASGEPSWITDIAADPGLERGPAALRCGLTGAFAFPISTGNRTLGAMEFFARRVWPPDLALTGAARAVGGQIAQFMVRKQAEERYRELVELSPNAILVHCDGRIVFANTATARLLGAAQPADLLGRSVYDFVHPDHRDFARERVARIVQHRLTLGAMEMKYVRMDGSVGHMEVSSSYFLYEGQPAVQAIARDVSERKVAEQKIIRLSNLYAALSQTNRAITRLTDAQSLFDQVCRIAAQYGNFELAAILMIDPQSKWVRPVAAAGVFRDYIETVRMSVDPDIPEGTGLTGTALRSGQPVICNDVSLDPRTLPWRSALLGTGLRSSANIPLRRRGEVVGALLLCASVTDYFDEQLVNLLVEMASNISFRARRDGQGGAAPGGRGEAGTARAVRRAHRAAQPQPVPGPAASGHGSGQAQRRDDRPDVLRPGPLQADQRYAGPQHRRQGPAGGRHAPEGAAARGRHHLAPGRGRVHPDRGGRAQQPRAW